MQCVKARGLGDMMLSTTLHVAATLSQHAPPFSYHPLHHTTPTTSRHHGHHATLSLSPALDAHHQTKQAWNKWRFFCEVFPSSSYPACSQRAAPAQHNLCPPVPLIPTPRPMHPRPALSPAPAPSPRGASHARRHGGEQLTHGDALCARVYAAE